MIIMDDDDDDEDEEDDDDGMMPNPSNKSYRKRHGLDTIDYLLQAGRPLAVACKAALGVLLQ